MGYRDATSATVITGSQLYQTAWTDVDGKIQSFDNSAGTRKVEKYFKTSTNEVLYKVIPDILMGWEYTGYLLSLIQSTDGKNFETLTPTGTVPGLFTSPIRKSGSRYFCGGFRVGNYYLYYTDDKIDWTEKESILADGQGFAAVGSNVVALSPTDYKFKYSSNSGATWTESAAIGSIAFSSIGLFSDGKVALFFAEDVGMGSLQAKVTILSDFSDTTGTTYEIGSSFSSYENVIASPSAYCDGTLVYIVVNDQGSMTSVMYSIAGGGTVTVVDSGATPCGGWQIERYGTTVLAYSEVSKGELISNAALTNPVDPGEYLSCPWYFEGNWYVNYFNLNIFDYQFYKSTNGGVSWSLDTTTGLPSVSNRFYFS